MKRVLVLGLMAIFLIGLVLAIENQSGNNNSNNNQSNTVCTVNSDCYPAGFVPGACGTFYVCTNNTCVSGSNSCVGCNTDNNCNSGYKCEDRRCILKENKNETNNDNNETDNQDENECEWQCTEWSDCLNQTKTRTCTNINNCTGETPKESKECEAKESESCCKITKTEDNETEYDDEETKECVSKGDKIKEVVNSSFCKEDEKERKRIHFEDRTGTSCTEGCTCRGVVMVCETEDGVEMTVFARSGNVIVQVRGINMTTNVTLYKVNKTVVGNFSGGERQIVLPDKVKEKIEEREKSKIEEQNIILDENGIYHVEGKKQSRLFFLVPVREKVDADVDSEDGQVIDIRNPWWGFLARDRKEV